MWRSSGVARRVLAADVHPRPPARPCLRPPAVGPEPPRDYAVPNGGWSDAMRRQYRRLLAMAATGAWARLPSYRSACQHLPEAPATPGDTRLFLRVIEGAGVGFEYAMFLNAAERRLLCLFQPSPDLEGHPGLTHGSTITAIIDGTLETCALAVAGKVITANLSIDYLAPIPLDAMVLLDSRAERLGGRKVFLSCHVQSAEGDTLHTRATGLFIRLDPTEHRTREEDGGR